MSRRSLIGRTGAQHRAASRMTVGTRMWSEQPTPLPYRGRATVTEPGPPLTLPSLATFHSNVFGRSGTAASPTSRSIGWAGLARQPAEGADLILAVSCRGQPVTLAAGWDVLASGSTGYHWWAVGHRTWTAGLTFDWTFGGKVDSGNYAGDGYRYLAFEGGSGGTWAVDVVWEGSGGTVTFADSSAPFRFGLLCGFGFWSFWGDPVPDGFGDPGSLYGKVEAQDPSTLSTSAWRSTLTPQGGFLPSRALPSGQHAHGTAGVQGTPYWANLIVRYS